VRRKITFGPGWLVFCANGLNFQDLAHPWHKGLIFQPIAWPDGTVLPALVAKLQNCYNWIGCMQLY
jgi:hypothetical protein